MCSIVTWAQSKMFPIGACCNFKSSLPESSIAQVGSGGLAPGKDWRFLSPFCNEVFFVVPNEHWDV